MYYGNGMYQNTPDSRTETEGSVITCYPAARPLPQDLSRIMCKHSDSLKASGYPSHPMSVPCPL